VLAVACLAGCATGELRGTATYLERIALPPNAVFEATLEDVSKAGAKSEVIGSTRIESPGNPHIAFVIPYDRSRIEPQRRYAVRARILVDGKLLYTTDQYYPLASEVAVTLRRAQADQRPNEPLENTYWKLTHLGERPVTTPERQREAHFILQRAEKRVVGSGGCNGITGGYELEGERLKFGRMAATMMACPVGMEDERAFLGALGRAERARIEQQQLELLDTAGDVVARFQAVHLR
jgi:putative lipoprotein